jgi:hypothetical protein
MTKIATSIEQSKILKGILPLESADMGWYYSKDPYAARNQMWLGTKVENADLPAWSLSALLEILPSYLGEFKDGVDFGLSKSVNGKWYSAHYLKTSDDGDLSAVYVKTGDTSIDACYEMVIKLHEEGLL